MEAFNGTVPSREKVMRSLKRDDTPILEGYRIFHNHVRPDMALDHKTPGQMARIEVRGEDKWLTLIQNASCNRKLDSARPTYLNKAKPAATLEQSSKQQ